MKRNLLLTLLLTFLMIGGGSSINATEVKVKLTQSMYKKWNSETTGEALETPTTITCNFVVGTSTGQPYGDGNVKWYNYADLSKYKALILEVTAGTPRVMYNREMKEGTPTDDGVNYVEINSNTTGGNLAVTDKGDYKEFKYDIQAIITGISDTDKKFFHLNAIKGANYQNVTVTKMYLLKDGDLEDGEEELLEYVDDGLASAPVTTFNYLEWTDPTSNATIVKAASSGAALWGVESDLVFGHGNVPNNKYADLKAFDRLEMVVSGAYPRLLMNRQDGNKDLREINGKSPSKYIKAYPHQEGTLYVLDIKEFVKDYGFMHLQSIKGTDYGRLILKSMVVRGSDEAIAAFKAQASQYVSSALTLNDYYNYIDTRNVEITTPIATGSSTKNTIIIANANQFEATVSNVMVGSKIANLTLTDGYAFAVPADATATAATHTRTIDATANYGTICLPYAVTSDANIQYYKLSAANGDVVTIETVDNVAAGTPAIFKKLNANATSLTMTGSGALTDALTGSASTGTVLTLKGVYSQKKVTDPTELAKLYYISGNKVMKATNSLTINPFRAYMEASQISNAKSSFFLTENEVTALNAIFNGDNNAEVKVVRIVNANGMMQNKIERGLNIVTLSNGKVQKILVK